VVAMVDKSQRISQIITAGRVVRNDEAVGSIPTSSTMMVPSLSSNSRTRRSCMRRDR
jgi:hypothetical protein